MRIAVEDIELLRLVWADQRVTHTSLSISTACSGGYADAVKFLMDVGMTPRTDDIYTAIKYGHIGVVEILLSNIEPTYQMIIHIMEDDIVYDQQEACRYS